MKKLCIHAVISGKVQGVFFRDSTRKKAEELNLTGWVQNLPNAQVELLACGDADSMTQFIEWLWQGPPLACVTEVDWTEENWQTLTAFNVLRD